MSHSRSPYESFPAGADPTDAASGPVTSPDVDYEAGGQGFVSRTALTQSISQSAAGRRSVAAGAQPQTHLVELDEMKSNNAAAASDVHISVDNRAPQDALWLLSPSEVAQRYPDSNISAEPQTSRGLTASKAAELLHLYGRNELKPPKEHSELEKYLLQFTDPFMALLIAAGILSTCIAYPLDTSQPINLYIGVVLWAVVILSATFSYVQEGKASSVMSSFKSMLPAQAKVIRDGREMSVPAAEIVVGDLLRIGTGDVVPADMRLIWTQDCKVETSSLTGESLPISCNLDSTGTEKIEQARNVCFNSSKCLEGESLGVVFATGDQTLIGQIAGLAGATKQEMTTLQKEIHYFVRNLTIFSIAMGAVFFAIAMARQPHKVIDNIINSFIVVMIANVPEGLPMTVVSCLTITAKRLSSVNVFVKQLQSVETLGSVTVIATDKTGTLTKNLMSVANMWFDGQSNTSDSIFQHYPPHRLQRNTGKSGDQYHIGATLENLELIAVICSKTKFEDERVLTPQQAKQMGQVQSLKAMDPTMTMNRAKVQFPTLYGKVDSGLTFNSARSKIFANFGDVMLDDASRTVQGDASETALFNFVRQRQSIELLRYHNPKVYDIPFNSRNKYAITITKPFQLENESPNKRTLFMKGAPEVIVARCSRYMRRGELLPCDDRFKAEFTEAYESFGSRGQRVLGFAMYDLPEDEFGAAFDSKYADQPEKIPTSGLTFVGLVSLVDPPKDSVPQAVLDCHTAGIRVIMVTGDHPLTAGAIARQVNIFQDGNFTRDELAKINNCRPEEIAEDDVTCITVKGPDLDHYTEQDWLRTLSKPNIVFARTTPTQKLQIVEHLQNMGNVVAATGDGVNDSPALKKADIGVAMGINGSDVARDAAAVILMDDDFSSIVVGVREGRTIFDNLTKTIAYTLTHMLPEVITVLLTIAFEFPQGMSSLMILTIDLFTETPPAVSMAYEPSESNVMGRPPRNAKTDRLVTGKVIGYSLLAGAVTTCGCYLAFFLVFKYYGITSSSLWNTKYFQDDDNEMPYYEGCNGMSAQGVSNFEDHKEYADGTGCFTASDQNKILYEAQTAYYAMLTCSQTFHIWFTKTRNVGILEHGLFKNEFTIWGVALEICIIILVVFAPSSNIIFFTKPFPPRFWGLLVLSPFVLGVYQEWRKAYVKRNPHSWVQAYLHW